MVGGVSSEIRKPAMLRGATGTRAHPIKEILVACGRDFAAARAACERALALGPAHYKARQNLEELVR